MQQQHQPRTDSQSDLLQQAVDRIRRGFAPPAEFYRSADRHRIDWASLPLWARPIDPDLFDGCCHEG